MVVQRFDDLCDQSDKYNDELQDVIHKETVGWDSCKNESDRISREEACKLSQRRRVLYKLLEDNLEEMGRIREAVDKAVSQVI